MKRLAIIAILLAGCTPKPMTSADRLDAHTKACPQCSKPMDNPTAGYCDEGFDLLVKVLEDQKRNQ